MASGALIALPAWAKEWHITDVITHDSSLTIEHQDILASVADTIIPGGSDTPGALTVGVDKFLQKLFDDCYEKETQDNINAQLKSLDAMAQKAHAKSFIVCDQAQREELLLKFEASENKAEKDFFDLVKSETIRGFNTSREVMTKYLNYKVAPGHYYGCVDVTA